MKKFEMPKLNLKGSEKQVKWATDIIAAVYTTANDNIKRAHDLQWPHAAKWEEGFEKIISQLEGFLSKTDRAGDIIACREKFDPERILSFANKYVNYGCK